MRKGKTPDRLNEMPIGFWQDETNTWMIREQKSNRKEESRESGESPSRATGE